MTTAREARLRAVQTIEQLIDYLRDELGWPIDVDDIDDAFFDYDADELGLDESTAAKVRHVRQLRPVVAGQPWGIFFVEFERRRLPIVALRRILHALVVKGRAQGADRRRWQTRDLLFVSALGPRAEREIVFAHFTDETAHGDLPTLRVLGWDDADTALQLDRVAAVLHERLRWPRDESNLAQWRADWRAAFVHGYRQAINTARDLAQRLAELATRIRRRANTVLALESERGPLRRLHKAVREALIHDLSADDFADMYAQTITYGLFTARVSRTAGLVADDVALMVPTGAPFLKELLEEFLSASGRARRRADRIDFDELGINEVVETLRDAPLAEVLRQFGNARRDEDPVIHFYEDFLKAYDREKRAKRGVFYTPKPVVQFIVASVDAVLRRDFGLEDGLADTATWGDAIDRAAARGQAAPALPPHCTRDTPFVRILDPAVGTATFLVEAIDLIHRTLRAKWERAGLGRAQIAQRWNDYVPRHLLPRLYGFELMMAPYAIAHMKLGLKLSETGYRFPEDGPRINLYLTNTLEPPHPVQERIAGLSPVLAHEARAANAAKEQLAATVVIGNPPYSASITLPPEVERALARWKVGLNEKKSDLSREEIKFMLAAALMAERVGRNVTGFITNRDFLDGATKRLMRRSLGTTFPARWIVDLNGDAKGAVADDNVFDIEQGVCVAVMATAPAPARLAYFSLIGTRQAKFDWLADRTVADVQWLALPEAPPLHKWTEMATKLAIAGDPYSSWPSVRDAFRTMGSGIQTKRDDLAVGFARDELTAQLTRFASLTPTQARKEFDLGEDGRDWTVSSALTDVRSANSIDAAIAPILYRPFDSRYIFYSGKTKGLVAYPRRETMAPMLSGRNLALICNRQVVSDTVSHFLVTRYVCCHGTLYLGNKGQDYLAPLWASSFSDSAGFLADAEALAAQSNFQTDFLARFRAALGADCPQPLDPGAVFAWMYAVFHSPTYRDRYRHHLQVDFPRVPLPASGAVLAALVPLGERLICLHLLESQDDAPPTAPRLSAAPTPLPLADDGSKPVFVGADRQLLKAGETGKSLADVTVAADGERYGRVYVNATSFFDRVPQSAWEFRVGGYQVCHKWLDDRRKAGRSLSDADIAHWRRIVVALRETIRTMAQIDVCIERHGGFPGAFAPAGAQQG